MPLQRQVISWPLTGGLDSKTAPLMVQPGSHIALDNVRQERTNEWRARNGFGNDATSDGLPGSLPALRSVQLPGGSLWAMARPTDFNPAVRSYAPSLTAGTSRWTSPTEAQTDQLAPSCWTRTPALLYRGTQILFPMRSCAVGGGYSLVANASYTTNGIDTILSADSGGDAAKVSGRFESGALVGAIACVFVASRLCLFWTTGAGAGGVLKATIWDTSTGAIVSNAITIAAGVPAGAPPVTQSFMDAIVYPGSSTVTIVFRNNATNDIRFSEYNPVTGALAANLTLAVDCSGSLSLLPDPDGSGIRFIATGTATPDTRVLRVNAAGAIQTNDQAHATLSSSATAGCAYQAGAGWMIVMRTSTLGLLAVKKRSAVISAATAVMLSAPLDYYLDTNAWREPSTDTMRVIVGLHAPDGIVRPASPVDPQDTFYEMAFAFEDGSATMTHYYNEPQSRLLPLNAGQGLQRNAGLAQVQRLSADKFSVALSRLNQVVTVANALAVQSNVYATDRWTVEYVNTSNVARLPQGQGVATGEAAFTIAGQLLQTGNGTQFTAHGASAAPFKPVLTPSAGAGGLTLLARYQYILTVELRDDRGNIWHSPPSLPVTVDLTGAQNTVQVDATIASTENVNRNRTLKIWRTKGNGSIFQLLTQSNGTAVTFSVSDTVSDVSLNPATFFPGTVQTTVSPAARAVATYGQRLWVVDRDFPSSIWFTRKFQTGTSPEFVGSFQLSVLDEEGECTNLAQLDDKLIVFKASAIYFVQGDGPDEAGTGSYPVAVRVDSDIGSIVGSPVVSTGQEVYFVSARGIYMIDRNLHVNFIGAPVDQYLNQPLVQTRETVVGAVFSPATNEVRFQTTNYRLVYDRLRGLWYRDTGAGMQNVVSTCMVGSKQALFKSDGTMWLEGDETVKQDNGVSYTPSIRSAWIRPSGTDGRLRLYMARIIMTRTSGGGTVTPTLRIYFDNDNSTFEFYTPAAIGGAQLLSKGSVQPRTHRCSAFSFEFLFAANDVSLRLEAWGAEVGMRAGAFRNNSGNAERWT